VPYTLLLADDSVTIQRVIELTFADEDITVIAVSDGDEAIERLGGPPPDIVLADIGMPGKNGYEVAQYIRESPRLSHIPVVLLTGAFEPVDQARADAAGCDGVLAKPFEPQLVVARVKELLGRARRGPEVSGPGNAAEAGDATAASSPLRGMGDDDSWASFPTEAPAAAPLPGVPAEESPFGNMPRKDLNDYFDRLDAAFSKFPPNAPTPGRPPVEASIHEPTGGLENDLNWFRPAVSETGSAEPWDVPAPPPDVASEEMPPSDASPEPETPFVLPPQTSYAAVNDVEPVAESAPAVEATAVVEAPPSGDTAPIDQPTPMEEEAAPVVEAISAPDERLAPIEESEPVEESARLGESVQMAPHSSFVPVDEAPTVVVPMAPVESQTTSSDAPIAPVAPALELPLPNPPPLPSLADAFAALLAAERVEPTAAGALWPATAPPAAAPPAPAVSDEVIEAITRRVLERLSDTVVRDAVSEIASKIAERLIQEEIERIKAAIK
jgi:CheY-like chemotaxis protein